MKVVKVYGALRDLLGKTRFEFVADTPAQAMRALLANFPGLDKWLIESEKRGVAYRVTVGKQKVHNDDASAMYAPWSEREVFSITPVLIGSGRGVGLILAGLALVAFSVFLPGVGAAIGGATMTKIGLFGGSLILAGISQMITPTPAPPKSASRLESNSFSGIANTTRQGTPVPIAYGRLFVGSAVISAGLDVDQV
jgi:predicted phage tail protein